MRKTLEEYLRSQTHIVDGVVYPVIDFSLRCEVGPHGAPIRFYIHPSTCSGDTTDFELRGNAITPNMNVHYPDDDANEPLL
jgi:hypothetical protein